MRTGRGGGASGEGSATTCCRFQVIWDNQQLAESLAKERQQATAQQPTDHGIIQDFLSRRAPRFCGGNPRAAVSAAELAVSPPPLHPLPYPLPPLSSLGKRLSPRRALVLDCYCLTKSASCGAGARPRWLRSGKRLARRPAVRVRRPTHGPASRPSSRRSRMLRRWPRTSTNPTTTSTSPA